VSDDAYARRMETAPSPDDADRDPDLAELEDLERDMAGLEAELENADTTPGE
jgi:hypothetical protein